MIPYDKLGFGYQATRRADPGIATTLRTLLRVEPQGHYLDVGCGTGNYTRALAAFGGHWQGVDPSEVMLTQARAANAPVAWHRGTAQDLPFTEAAFDGVMCTNAIHHFGELVPAFAAVRRVMRNGRFVIFTGLGEQACNYWLRHYFPQMIRSAAELSPSRETIRTALLTAGFQSPEFVPYLVTPDLADLFLYSGKHRPQLYLRDDVRSNITSFVRLCPPEELTSGLAQLRDDLRTGAFDGVRAAYSDEGGDYVYVVADAE